MTDQGSFYFEAEVVATARHEDSNDDNTSFFYTAIGMCAKPRKLLGWALGDWQRGVKSYAYLENGEILSEYEDYEVQFEPYRIGDTVGCGFSMVDRWYSYVFWTRNGVFIGKFQPSQHICCNAGRS